MGEQGEATAEPVAEEPAVAATPASTHATAAASVESVAEGAEPPYAAGYVFLCRTATQLECMEKLLFASRDRDFDKMERAIGEKTQIFLINVNNGTMVGTYLPSGAPERSIEPGAFGSGFEAQLRVQPMTDPLAAVKIEKRIHGGPKTAFEVEEIQLMFLSGTGVDPWTIDNNKIGEYTQPAASSGWGGKGKGMSGKGWRPNWPEMANLAAAFTNMLQQQQQAALAGGGGGGGYGGCGGCGGGGGSGGGGGEASWSGVVNTNWRPSWPAQAGGVKGGCKGKRNTLDAAPWPAATPADPTNGGRVPATVEVPSTIAQGIAMGEANSTAPVTVASVAAEAGLIPPQAESEASVVEEPVTKKPKIEES